MAQSAQPKVTSIKTYVGGNFLFSEEGFDYEEKPKAKPVAIQSNTKGGVEKVIEDKIGIGEVKRQIAEKRREIKRKKEGKNEKIQLIPIRDEPVEPIPQPPKDNQKCEMATQEQFEFFQSYVRQKEKERKFEQEQQMHMEMFELQQQALRAKREGEEAPSRGITLVMQKEEAKPKKRPLMKITIRRKGENEDESSKKVRVLNPASH